MKTRPTDIERTPERDELIKEGSGVKVSGPSNEVQLREMEERQNRRMGGGCQREGKISW